MMKTKLLFQRFFASLLLLAASSLSWADKFVEGGIYYNTLEGTNVEVTSNGKGTYSGSVTIPATVTHEAVTYNVTRIGDNAFDHCSGLTAINIPEGVTSIGKAAINFCSDLTTINIPSSVTSIDNENFVSCTSLPVENNVRYADTYLVEATNNTLNSYTIKGGTRFIGYNAFLLCTKLESITIPEGVTSIGETAFMGCTKLTTVNIPGSVTSIGDGAFSTCTGLTTVNIPESVTSIGYRAFQNCTSLPAIDYVRYADTYLVGVTDNEKSSYAIKEGTRFIGDDAFSNCNSLVDVIIPKNVISIGKQAFYGCDNLARVCNLSATPQELGSGAFVYSVSRTLYVLKGCVDTYKGNASWSTAFGANIVELEHVDVTIPAGGTRTFCNFADLDFSEVSGLKAYIISGFSPSTGTLTLTRVTRVPAGTGLLLRGEEGNYEVPVLATDMYYSNMLKGVNEAIMLAPTEGEYTNFILANGDHGVGFYPVSTTDEFAAGKAYLQMPTAKVPTPSGGSEARCFILNFDDEEATGIGFTKATAPQEDGVYYDLTGRRVEKPSKGFYILNGKKMFIW